MDSMKYFEKYEHSTDKEILAAYDTLREKLFIIGEGSEEEELEIDILNFIIIEKFKEFVSQ